MTHPVAFEIQRTASSPPLDKILSVVAATLPPLRCKSHIISLLPICGNIVAICSTCAGSAVLGLARGAVVEELEKKK